ncbi:MAG: hypothetical protein J0I09_07375 [Sphingobacteriia bacterium]|nr:hypothetical protein [Sphingobacteriia bacterium]
MKKYFIFILPYLIFCLTFNSCTRNVDNNSNLVGQWQWAYSYGGLAVQKINSSPNIVKFDFRSDMMYTYMENGVIKSTDKYQLTQVNSNQIILSLSNFNASKLWLSPNGEIFTIKKDTLTFTDYLISDGYNHYFQKIQ